jgi:hypothetical protein
MKSGHSKGKRCPFPLVLIEWHDAARPDAEWHYLNSTSAMEAVRCLSVGFLIHDGKEAKALAPNLGEIGTPDMQACGIIRIPTRCVLSMSHLRA